MAIKLLKLTQFSLPNLSIYFILYGSGVCCDVDILILFASAQSSSREVFYLFLQQQRSFISAICFIPRPCVMLPTIQQILEKFYFCDMLHLQTLCNVTNNIIIFSLKYTLYWCSAAHTHLKLLDRAVSGAWFLTGGVFEYDIAHR